MDLSKLFEVRSSSSLYPYDQDVRAIEAKIDLLLEFLQIKQPDELTLPLDIEAHLMSGRKIEAIKLYRERFNVGLKEAKDAIDAVEKEDAPLSRIQRKLDTILDDLGIVVAERSPDTGSEMAEVEAEIRRGHKIAAIKLYRELRNSGLKEAKDAVEEMERRLSER